MLSPPQFLFSVPTEYIKWTTGYYNSCEISNEKLSPAKRPRRTMKRNMNLVVGTHNILFITLDTLRFDVAQNAFQQNQLKTLVKWLPDDGWQRRHTPANFTYAAHHAFFSGFLPTPCEADQQTPRLFASSFPGSETTGDLTCVFEEATIVEGLANRGYATHCIGGVGFFNKLTALGNVLPGLFQRSYWAMNLGVTDPHSAENQVQVAHAISLQTTARSNHCFCL